MRTLWAWLDFVFVAFALMRGRIFRGLAHEQNIWGSNDWAARDDTFPLYLRGMGAQLVA